MFRKSLGKDETGVAAVEFAILAPVLLTFLLGSLDVGHRLYTKSVMQGALQKAARDAGLEGGSIEEQQTLIDAQVIKQLRPLHADADITFRRRSYRTFSQASSPAEPFSDTDGDGQCNKGEPYTDINNNGARDLDIGVSGQGGAEDAVVYEVRMRYPAVTPVLFYLGVSPDVDFTAQTVLRNQPYNDQGQDAAPTTKNCI